MLWPDGILPANRYIYATISEMDTECQSNQGSIEWKPLDEAEERIQKLMQWVYNYHVIFMDDCRVACYEEIVYQVNSATWAENPSHWEIALDVFDMWDSVCKTVSFRLAG